MPSLQSRAVSLLLKRLVKARCHAALDVGEVRLAVATAMRLVSRHSGVTIQASRQPQLQGEWAFPAQPAHGRTVLYLHGGGYFFGSPATHRPLTTRLAAESGARVFSLSYRLAPEHRYPAALEDAVAAYQQLLQQGFCRRNLVIAGDSAGGGLTLALLVALRDRGLPLPAAAVCFSPWTDLAGTGASLRDNDLACAMFRGEALRASARHYLGEANPFDPLVSPLYADFEGLPPLLLHVSDSEVLRDDSTRLAEKAGLHGVEVCLKIWSDQPHVWQLFPHLPEARDSLSQAAEFVRTWTPGRGSSWWSLA